MQIAKKKLVQLSEFRGDVITKMADQSSKEGEGILYQTKLLKVSTTGMWLSCLTASVVHVLFWRGVETS